MRHEMTVAVPPTIPSLPASLQRFVTGNIEGQPTCRRALTETERQWVTSALTACRAALGPASRDEILVKVARLLLAFPIQELSEATARSRAEGYITALTGLPVWAIDRGCTYWMRCQFSEPDDNYAFAPSPSQLSRLCRIAVAEARQRESQLIAILNATSTAVQELSQEARQRRVERLKALSVSLTEG